MRLSNAYLHCEELLKSAFQELPADEAVVLELEDAAQSFFFDGVFRGIGKARPLLAPSGEYFNTHYARNASWESGRYMQTNLSGEFRENFSSF